MLNTGDWETDEDIMLEGAHRPPPDLSTVAESQQKAELGMIVRWIVTLSLLSILQTLF